MTKGKECGRIIRLTARGAQLRPKGLKKYLKKILKKVLTKGKSCGIIIKSPVEGDARWSLKIEQQEMKEVQRSEARKC